MDTQTPERKALTCTRVIVKTDQTRDQQGNLIHWHEKCGRPAEEVILKGELTVAVAVLCYQHRWEAEAELLKQANGKKAKKPDPRQMSFLSGDVQ